MQVEHPVLLEFVVLLVLLELFVPLALLLSVLLVLLKLFEPLVVLLVLILVDPFFCKLMTQHPVEHLA
jgi:hypothetical protein